FEISRSRIPAIYCFSSSTYLSSSFYRCCRLPVPKLQILRSWASSMLSSLSVLTVVSLFSSFCSVAIGRIVCTVHSFVIHADELEISHLTLDTYNEGLQETER
ncbi:hypothetical protein L9F63_021657, partial [Diploptera punctata]